jgi:hypothetical protein
MNYKNISLHSRKSRKIFRGLQLHFLKASTANLSNLPELLGIIISNNSSELVDHRTAGHDPLRGRETLLYTP